MLFTLQAIRGCILAGAVGDALGGPGEGRGKSLSDDTYLTLATCEAIIDVGAADPASIAKRMLMSFVSGEVTGIGASTLKAMRDLQAGGHWALSGARGDRAAGNGAAMRAAPLAFCLDPTVESHRVRLRDIARITHHNDEAYVGALAVVIALGRASVGLDWSNDAIAAELPDSRVRDHVHRASSLSGIEAAVMNIGSSGFVAETIPVAFELARRMLEIGLEGAMDEMNEVGGDTDTIGSIAGQIWGAATGFDSSHLLLGIQGTDRVVDVADRFAHLMSHTSEKSRL